MVQFTYNTPIPTNPRSLHAKLNDSDLIDINSTSSVIHSKPLTLRNITINNIASNHNLNISKPTNSHKRVRKGIDRRPPHRQHVHTRPMPMIRDRVQNHQITHNNNNNENLCQYLPRNIWSVVHHKTGHDFSWNLGAKFKDFCGKQHQIVTEFSFIKFLQKCNPMYCAYLHWVRHPLNTIISGYYYHLKTDEEWVQKWTIKNSINTAIEMDTDKLYQDILDHKLYRVNHYEVYRKEKILHLSGTGKMRMEQRRKKGPKLIPCFDIGNNSYLYQYIGNFVDEYIMTKPEYQLNVEVTLQRFYNDLKRMDYRIGLFYEFVRYFRCEWASIYVFQQIGNSRWNNKGEYDIDEFMHGKFEENMNKLLNQLNIPQYGEDIKDIRDNFMNRLKALDVSETKKPDMHITHNDYDIEKVTDDLLSLDVEICKLIKNMTVLLRFEWDHDQYC